MDEDECCSPAGLTGNTLPRSTRTINDVSCGFPQYVFPTKSTLMVNSLRQKRTSDTVRVLAITEQSSSKCGPPSRKSSYTSCPGQMEARLSLSWFSTAKTNALTVRFGHEHHQPMLAARRPVNSNQALRLNFKRTIDTLASLGLLFRVTPQIGLVSQISCTL